jgi:hypothetical protein
MKRILFVLAAWLATVTALAQSTSMPYTDYSFRNQVNIGGPQRNTSPSAFLELGAVNGSTRGLLLPRGNRFDVLSPVTGLLFYDVNDKLLYQFDGSVWLPVGAPVNISGKLNLSDTAAMLAPYVRAGTVWRNGGNVATSSDFLGTTNNQPLRLRVNNLNAGVISLGVDVSGITNSFVSGLPNPAGSTYGGLILGFGAGEGFRTTNNLLYNVAIGHKAMNKAGTVSGLGTPDQNVAIGINAMYYTIGSGDPFGGRNVAVGNMPMYRNTTGWSNVAVGDYAMELNNTGNTNVAIGRDALRSNIDGNGNQAVGLFALLRNTTGIASIPVANGGSGYTFANVTISAPLNGSPGGSVSTATATATVSGGQVTAINVTWPGAGYTSSPRTYEFGSHPPIVITITGDGTGAVAGTPVLRSGDNNAAMGHAAGWGNRIGQRNSMFGGFADVRHSDDENTMIGYGTGVGAGAPAKIVKATALGYNAKVSQSNNLVLGGTGGDAVSVAVGATAAHPSALLDLTSTGKGVLFPRLTTAERNAIASPAMGLMVYSTTDSSLYIYNSVGWVKVGSGVGSGTASRFGAEDATANTNRLMNMAGNKLTVHGASNILFKTTVAGVTNRIDFVDEEINGDGGMRISHDNGSTSSSILFGINGGAAGVQMVGHNSFIEASDSVRLDLKKKRTGHVVYWDPATKTATADSIPDALLTYNAGPGNDSALHEKTDGSEVMVLKDHKLLSSDGSVTIEDQSDTNTIRKNIVVSSGGITAAKMANNSVGPAALINTGITPGTYTNPTITFDADGRATSVSNGTAGSGSGGGDVVLLSTNSYSNVADATLDLSSHTANYRVIRIRILQSSTTTNGNKLYLRTSTDGGTSFATGGADYKYSWNWGNGIVSSGGADKILLYDNWGANAANTVSGDIKLFNLASSSIVFACGWEFTAIDSGDLPAFPRGSGLRNALSSINAVQLLWDSGVGSFTLQIWGEK